MTRANISGIDAPRDPSFLVVGAGFIGRHLADELAIRSIATRLLTRNNPTNVRSGLAPEAEMLIGDAGDAAVFAAAIEGVTDVVWAVNSLMPGESEQDPISDMTLMLQPLLTCLEVLRSRPDVSFTLVSSGGTVYGQPSLIPTPEHARTEPLSSYGITRLTAEKFALRHGTMTGATVRVARVANAYGPGQSAARGQGVVAATIEHAVAGTALRLFGGGETRRDFIHIDDVAHYLADYALADDAPRILNIGSGTSVPIRDVVALVQTVTGLPVTVVDEPARPFDVACVQLDVSQLQSLSTWRCRPLADGIATMWPPHATSATTDAAVATVG